MGFVMLAHQSPGGRAAFVHLDAAAAPGSAALNRVAAADQTREVASTAVPTTAPDVPRRSRIDRACVAP